MATKKEIHTEEIVETEVKKPVVNANCKYDTDEQITCRSLTY